MGIDVDKIKKFAFSDEAKKMLIENISLTKELKVGRGPVILIDNRKIFGVQKGNQGYELLKSILVK